MLQAQQVLQNRYTLKHKLGQNAGRQTWLAEDRETEFDELVIVKLLAFADQVNWETLKLFEREAAILRQLQHPQIPKYRDYFAIDDRVLWFGLVQNYIPGTSLKDLLTQHSRFPVDRVTQIATELLQILIYLHELSPPVLHRDIKPSNLIWGEDQHIHLIDFGAVQDRAAVEGATFTVVGTYGYAPIEQFGGRTVPASDLYSLGATLIHLLTGTAPADLPQRNLRIQFANLVSASPYLVRWIERLTDPDVSKRFETARQALTALQSAAHSSEPARFKPVNSTRLATQRSTSSHLAEGLSPPVNTKVELYRSDDELVIRCPGDPNARTYIWIGVVISVFGLVAPIPLFPLLMLGIALLWAGLVQQVATIVQFNRCYFRCYKQPLFNASPDNIAQERIENIEAVIHHDLQFVEGKTTQTHRVVTIQTRLRDHSFGRGLRRAECAWLVQEINDWLRRSRPSTKE